jgi:hypothetical protein
VGARPWQIPNLDGGPLHRPPKPTAPQAEGCAGLSARTELHTLNIYMNVRVEGCAGAFGPPWAAYTQSLRLQMAHGFAGR